MFIPSWVSRQLVVLDTYFLIYLLTLDLVSTGNTDGHLRGEEKDDPTASGFLQRIHDGF